MERKFDNAGSSAPTKASKVDPKGTKPATAGKSPKVQPQKY